MSLIGPTGAEEILKRTSKFADQDCGSILNPQDTEISAEDFLKSAHLFLAWLLKPSLFDFNMRNGNDFLATQIFEFIEIAIYFLPQRDAWLILTRSERIQQFADPIGPSPTTGTGPI